MNCIDTFPFWTILQYYGGWGRGYFNSFVKVSFSSRRIQDLVDAESRIWQRCDMYMYVHVPAKWYTNIPVLNMDATRFCGQHRVSVWPIWQSVDIFWTPKLKHMQPRRWQSADWDATIVIGHNHAGMSHTRSTLPRVSATKQPRACILVQVTIYRRLLIGRDGHLDQSEAYDIS